MSSTTRLFLLSILLGFHLTGCTWMMLLPSGDSDTHSPSPAATAAPGPGPAPSASPSVSSSPTPTPGPSNDEILKRTYNSSTAQHQTDLQTYEVERHFQRVIRKSCDGQVTSDKEETVRFGQFDLSLKAPSFRKYKGVIVYNDKTGDTSLTALPLWDIPLLGMLFSVTGSGRGAIKVKADLANAVFTFHVENGLNDIYVEYDYDCVVRRVRGSGHVNTTGNLCDEAKDKVIVHYPVQVNYSEKHLNGFKEVRPTEKECADLAKKKIPLAAL